MAEYIRGVKVHIEVDTNKDTQSLYLSDVDLETAQHEIAEFFDAMGQA